MSENTASKETPMSKQEIEDKLDKTQLMINTYQAAVLNKMLANTGFKLDLFENVKKKVNSSGKNKKKKPKMTSKPPEYQIGDLTNLSDSGQNISGRL